LGSGSGLSGSSSGSSGLPDASAANANNTELILVPGTNRLTLSAQRPLIWVIVQDTIENLRALLLFDHTFPNAVKARRAIQKSILAAANKYRPGATAIYKQLNRDEEYMLMLARLVNDFIS
jgi:hypothetical protein